ncbi:MAG: S-layer homology domain-containing protein [Ruminococcus sp.]|nr:S-layer homology domain-containing protein [Candidatus Copronaster equi]
MIKFKSIVSIILCIIMLTPTLILSGASGINGNLPYGITEEMCTADFWKKNALIDPDKLLMTPEDIDKINKLGIDTYGSYVFDIENMPEPYDGVAFSKKLADNAIPTTDYYIDGKLIDNNTYFGTMNTAIANTGFTETECYYNYAVCVNSTALKSYPSADIVGYSADDTDDELQTSALLVNEPFFVKQKCSYGGNVFYYGYARNLTGWVNAADMALCSSKSQWIDAWKVDTAAKDFIVVTQSKITLEDSRFETYYANKLLTYGTVLKLVPDSEMPKNIGERSTWFNYVVYMPTRKSDGTYEKKSALISMHNKVSVGFLPYTQSNILDVAFGCIGDRYGWGNTLNATDCSGFIRNINRCFGLEIPRNTTYQQLLTGTKIDLSAMNATEKAKFISTLPIGTALYMSGHTVLYVGTFNGVNYVINNTGSYYDSDGSEKLNNVFSVSLNPLTVRRSNGKTWLENMTSAVVFPENYENTLPFHDIPANSWYRNAVDYCYENALMTGVSENTFAPNSNVTRAMAVFTLYKIAGFAKAENEYTFSDVTKGSWYYDAIMWAKENDIVYGYDGGIFKPNNKITREQLAVIFHKFASVYGKDVSKTSDLSVFPDYQTVAGWSKEALSYCVASGLMTGSDIGGVKYLKPQSYSTRAMLAVMLMKFEQE